LFQRNKYGGIGVADTRRLLSDFFFSTRNLPWRRFKLLEENQEDLCLPDTGMFIGPTDQEIKDTCASLAKPVKEHRAFNVTNEPDLSDCLGTTGPSQQ
jgi:hypothetical protein